MVSQDKLSKATKVTVVNLVLLVQWVVQECLVLKVNVDSLVLWVLWVLKVIKAILVAMASQVALDNLAQWEDLVNKAHKV